MTKKRAAPIPIPTFNPKQTLKSIREESLNPVIERVLAVEGNIEDVVVPKINTAYDKVSFDDQSSKLSFINIGGITTEVDLSAIVPPFAGIEVEGYTTHSEAGFPGSGDVKNASIIKFADATVTKVTPDITAQVVYEWGKIVPAYQAETIVDIEGAVGVGTGPYDKIEVKGVGAKDYFTYTRGTAGKKGTVRIDMPIIPDQMIGDVIGSGQVSNPKPIKKIEIKGDVGGSIIVGDTLQVDLSSGGAKFNVGYFKGFYNSTDEIPSDNLFTDRSSAYVKTDIKGATVYTLYMYKGVTDKWKPVLNNVPLILNDAQKQAIFSVKPNKDISLTANGELNLDKLMNTDDSGYLGIFESVDALAGSGLPVKDKSMALVRDDTRGVFLSYTYRIGENPSLPVGWVITPVEGSLKFVDDKISEPSYKPIYGVKANTGISLGSDGLLTLEPPEEGTIQVKAKDSEEHLEKTEAVKGVHFVDGIYVDLVTEPGWAVVKHPQRVVHYNDEFETKHKSSNFMGNIFFDTETSSWIGWSEGKGGTAAVTPKWTPIAHRGMSDQVTSLDDRYPEQMTPSTVGTPTEDDWNRTSHDYLPQGNPNLPDEIKTKTGGFIQTVVKKNTAATGAPSDEIRSQICRPDDGSGGVWQRSYKFNDKVWNPWVKTSFTTEDLKAHEVDPHAHNNVLRYYRTYALFGNLKKIFTQQTGQTGGGLIDDNSILLADNYGYSSTDPHDYLDAPYDGKFNISGAISFNGYGTDTAKKPDKATDGRWQLLIRKRNSTTTQDYTSIGLFTYDFKSTNKIKKYPTLSFSVQDVELKSHQEVVININFVATGTSPPSPGELITKHARLYLTPTRSNITIEDSKTRAGSAIATAFRVLYGNLDTLDDVGVRAHHTDPTDPTSGIRVYGEKVQKKATPMTYYP